MTMTMHDNDNANDNNDINNHYALNDVLKIEMRSSLKCRLSVIRISNQWTKDWNWPKAIEMMMMTIIMMIIMKLANLSNIDRLLGRSDIIGHQRSSLNINDQLSVIHHCAYAVIVHVCSGFGQLLARSLFSFWPTSLAECRCSSLMIHDVEFTACCSSWRNVRRLSKEQQQRLKGFRLPIWLFA